MRASYLLPILMTGCATIFTKSEQTISVRTSPPGATIYVDNIKREGVTPMEVTFDKTGDPIELRFEKEGFLTQHFYLKRGMYWLYTIDWIFLLPGAFDSFFVNHCNYKPHFVHVDLRQEIAPQRGGKE